MQGTEYKVLGAAPFAVLNPQPLNPEPLLPMILGFVSAILPDLSLAEVAQFAAQTGYTCTSVSCAQPANPMPCFSS